MEPDSQQPKHGCPADSREEASPVISDREEDWGDLYAEQDATYRRTEATGDANGHRSRKHLTLSWLVGVNALFTQIVENLNDEKSFLNTN